MLNPNKRLLYLEQLAPPPRFQLDRALATTFTLDLLALLAVPVSMAGLEVGSPAENGSDAVRILESLRRAADRFAVFCQQGRIAIPKRATPLFGLLENAVVEVQNPAKLGVFHPKVWVLRYVAEDEPVLYRVLCLSRNLTFDHSWDTILCLEGQLEDRQRGFGANRPLVDFIQALPRLAVRGVGESTVNTVALMADEVRKVRFQCPDGFDQEHVYLPMGIPGYGEKQLENFDRALIVSPFVTEQGVQILGERGRRNVLISRADQLDALPDSTVAALQQRTDLFTMDDTVTLPDLDDDGAAEANSATSGLHAKLYLLEKGWNASLLTGSANATGAAWRRNVEFVVRLSGRRARMGIDQLLGSEKDKHSWRSMLQPYCRQARDAVADEEQRQLELAMQSVAEKIMRSELYVEVIEEREHYGLALRAPAGLTADLAASVKCHPVTLPAASAKTLEVNEREGLVFSSLSGANLTSFWAFSVTLKGQTVEFVLNLPVRNMPLGRDKHILRAVVDDQEKFVRYLLLMLGDDDAERGLGASRNGHSGANGTTNLELPLLEELIRGASRTPERLLGLAELVEELMQSDEGRRVLPEGFELIWPALLAICEGQGGARDAAAARC